MMDRYGEDWGSGATTLLGEFHLTAQVRPIANVE